MANGEKQSAHVEEACSFEITLRRLLVKWCHL